MTLYDEFSLDVIIANIPFPDVSFCFGKFYFDSYFLINHENG